MESCNDGKIRPSELRLYPSTHVHSAVWTKDIFKMSNVGLYSGLLVGISSFAAALSSPFLGWL